MNEDKLITIFIGVIGISVLVLLGMFIAEESSRVQYVSKCVLDNQNIPNPQDVCQAKYNLR